MRTIRLSEKSIFGNCAVQTVNAPQNSSSPEPNLFLKNCVNEDLFKILVQRVDGSQNFQIEDISNLPVVTVREAPSLIFGAYVMQLVNHVSRPESFHIVASGDSVIDMSTIICDFKKLIPQEKADERELLFLEAAKRFKQFPQVKAIYIQECREDLFIYGLLDIKEYDDDLMDSLLDEEYEIRQQFKDFILSFFYPPIGDTDRKDVVHPASRCIFSR